MGKQVDIIVLIKHRLKDAVLAALAEEPTLINSIDHASTMNAMMVAAHLRLADYIEPMSKAAGSYLNYRHQTASGEDLLNIAWPDEDTRVAVIQSYEAHAPQIFGGPLEENDPAPLDPTSP